jgi:ABC-type microcin C transport system permease subunit YejB
MNAHESRCPYIPQAVPGSPSSADISNYKSGLVFDISSDSAPLIGDAWETANSAYHLVGHPTDRTIFHWFDIRGFTSTGGNTLYEDSVHNATSVSWYASVPAYSTQLSNQIVTIVGGRGYVW